MPKARRKKDEQSNNNAARPLVENYYGFSWFDTLMAWCAVLFGYLIIRLLPLRSKPAGAALLLLAMYAVAFIWFRKSGVRPSVRSLVFAATGIAMLPAFVLSDLGWLAPLLFFSELVIWLYFVYSAPGNSVETGVGQYFWLDAAKAVFVMPAASLPALAGAAVGKTRGKGKKVVGTLLWILLGLLAAIIPTLIVTELLSFDENFRQIIKMIFDLDLEWLADRLMAFLFGLPLAFWGFAAFVSSRQKLSDKITGEQCGRGRGGQSFPAPLIYATMTPVLTLYAIFFVSQWGYYTTAFYGVLPDGFVYSSYARSGFPALCGGLSQRAGTHLREHIRAAQKQSRAGFAQGLFGDNRAVHTYPHCDGALENGALYDAYGLTLKRVYVSWLLIFMVAGFIYAIVAQLTRRFRFNFALLLTGR